MKMMIGIGITLCSYLLANDKILRQKLINSQI